MSEKNERDDRMAESEWTRMGPEEAEIKLRNANMPPEGLVLGLDVERLCLDWQADYQDFEVHAAKVTEQIEGCGKPDIVIKRVGVECVAGSHQ